MIDLFAVLRSLTLPGGAQPGTPRIVLGPDQIPPELVTYYAGETVAQTVVNGTLYQKTGTDYTYDMLIQSTIGGVISRVMGIVVAGAVQEEQRLSVSGGPVQLVLGGHSATPGTLTLKNGSSLFLQSGSVFNSNASSEVDINGPLFIDGVSASRGLKDRASAAVGTGAVGAEAVVLTGNTIVWVAGRAYEVIGFGDTSGSIASNTAFLTLRRNNVAGTILGAFQQTNSPTAGNGTTIHARIILRNNTGADVIDNIVLTLLASGGGTVSMAGGGVYSFVRYLEVRDVGAASDYPNATQI